MTSRSFALVATALAVLGCPRREPPPAPPRDPNVQLHVEHAIGVPIVDIRNQPEAGTTRVQIGGAAVQLPNREPDPPPAE